MTKAGGVGLSPVSAIFVTDKAGSPVIERVYDTISNEDNVLITAFLVAIEAFGVNSFGKKLREVRFDNLSLIYHNGNDYILIAAIRYDERTQNASSIQQLHTKVADGLDRIAWSIGIAADSYSEGSEIRKQIENEIDSFVSEVTFQW